MTLPYGGSRLTLFSRLGPALLAAAVLTACGGSQTPGSRVSSDQAVPVTDSAAHAEKVRRLAVLKEQMQQLRLPSPSEAVIVYLHPECRLDNGQLLEPRVAAFVRVPSESDNQAVLAELTRQLTGFGWKAEKVVAEQGATFNGFARTFPEGWSGVVAAETTPSEQGITLVGTAEGSDGCPREQPPSE